MPVLKEVNVKKLPPLLKFAPACAVALSLFSGPVFAANVVLKNGDRLTGEIVKLSDNILTLKSPLFGEVELPWKQVLELQSDDPRPGESKNCDGPCWTAFAYTAMNW